MFALITTLIRSTGLVGVFVLMLVENLVPVIPSEVILPMAGYEAGQGRMSPVLVVIAGTAGSVLGALAWYGLGRWLGLERVLRLARRHGRWLTMNPQEIERADRWFRRWGVLAVAVGRALPGVRGVISIPAGVAAMPLPAFIAGCTLGSLAWSGLLTWAGLVLRDHYGVVQRWLDPVTSGFMVVCALAYLWRVITFKPR